MLNIKNNPSFTAAIALVVFLAAMSLYGCNSSQPASGQAGASTQPVTFALFGPPPERSGAQLWADNCMRCHNGRPPEEFSNAQWAAIVHHMRLRADLTGEEEREIVKFLQASN